MRWQPLQVVGGAYTDDATPWTAQDCVNYIPVMAEKAGARSPAMLRQAPGAEVFSITGSGAPIRGLHNAEGLLLTVSAQSLYRIGTDGAATSIGTIPGVKRCSIAHNQITAGNQVAIANGSSGYIYNTTTAALTQITDDGFPGAKVFDFVDQYIVGVEPMGRYWFWSDLAAAGDYNTLDRAEAETAPDKIVTLITTHGEVFVLGERTSEFFYNTGAATGTFQRREAGMEVGCGAQHSVVRIDNSVVWLGHDGSVYRLQGYQPVRISTHQIEQAIGRCNWADAYAYTFEDAGHKIYYLTFTDGQTFGFDMATGEWHRRKSYGLDFWRMSHLVRWGRTWIAGDYTNGKLYSLDWRVNNEAGEPMERMRTLPPIHDHGNRLIVNALKLEIDTGKTAESFPLPQTILEDLAISGDLPGGDVAIAIDTYAYVLTGGVLPVTCSIISGSLPDGLSMSSAGVVTGTPTTAGSYSWEVQATDANGDTATLSDSATIADDALTIAVSQTILFSINGGGATGWATQNTDNTFSNVTDTSEPWARIFVHAYDSNNTDLPPETRTIIYDAINLGGATFYDSGWRGNTAHQSAMDSALVTFGLSAYAGTITSDTMVTYGTYDSFLYASDPFVLPTNFGTYSGRVVNYRHGTRLDNTVYLEYPNPASIPVGATKVAGVPGYYITPGGQTYRVAWTGT